MKIFQEIRGRVFMVITPEELTDLPHGTILQTIDGDSIGIVGRKGEFEINMDTRFGHLAYGFWLPCFNQNRVV